MGEAAHVLEGLPENPLPASLEVRLKKPYRNLESIEETARALSSLKGVADVEYGGGWMKRFFAFVRILRWLALSLGVLLLFASVIVISSTLTPGFYARKEEIEILRLVGATETYIRFPFFLESLLQGVGGSVLALVLLWILYQGFRINTGSTWSLFAGWVQLHPGRRGAQQEDVRVVDLLGAVLLAAAEDDHAVVVGIKHGVVIGPW